MINIFQLDFYSRIRAWKELREQLADQPLDQQCIKIDEFWQKCPTMSYHLHPHDMETWPDPWQLLDENLYCPYSRALGMIYTLKILGIQKVDLIDCLDHNGINVVLVSVDSAKYILNYWPGAIVNNNLNDFTVVRYHDLTPLNNKIGKL